MAGGDERRVRRRAAFFVPGYDPRRPSVYHALFTAELEAAARLRGFTARAGPLEEPDGPTPRVALAASGEVDGEAWSTETSLTILRWDDIIREPFRRAFLPRLPMLLQVGLQLSLTGVFRRLAKVDGEFASFIAYPYVMTFFLLMAIPFTGIAVWSLVNAVSPAAAVPAGLAVSLAIAWAGYKLEKRLYLRYLLEDWLFSFAHERGEIDTLVARTEIFADAICAAAKKPDIDEVLIIGHSSGAFLAPETLALALARDPDLGRHGPEVSLLTIGTIAPLMLADTDAFRYRDAVARLADEPSIPWHEVQSRHDVMNVSRSNPAVLSGRFSGPTRWPKIMKLSMPLVAKPGQLGLFRERLMFFRTHFRWLRANERVAWYDFYGILTGPRTLAARHEPIPDERADIRTARAPSGWG